MPDQSRYVAGHSRLELAGRDAGPLRSVEGGDSYSDVVEETPYDASTVVRKHADAVHYTDIAVECALNQSGPLLDWISETLGRSGPQRGGAIVEQNERFEEVSRLTFENAIIREVEFPALVAADKGLAHLTVRFAPGSTRLQAGSGVKQTPAAGAVLGTSKKGVLGSEFRLKIDGLDASRASQVGRLTVRQVLAEYATKDGSVQLTPGGLKMPDLVVTLQEAADWYAWRDAVIVGGSGAERTGTLEYLSSGTRDVIARIEFSGLGLHSLVRERGEEGAERSRRVRASIYCENLSYGLVAAAPSRDSKAISPPSRVEATAALAAARASARSGFARLA